MRALQDSKPAFLRDPGVHAGFHGANPVAAPVAPFEAAEPALQLTREQLQKVVGIVSAHHRGTAAGRPGLSFEMMCAAYPSSDAALDVTPDLVHLLLSGELPQEAFLFDGLLIGLEKPGGGVRPIAISETWYRFAGACVLWTYGTGNWRTIGPAAGGGRHTRRHGDCGACACVSAC